MIPAPFLAGCPTAFDRAVWVVLSREWIDGLPWPIRGELASILPALAVTVVALAAWHARRANLSACAFVLAAVVHPPLTVALLPVFLASPRNAGRTMSAILRSVFVLAATGAVLLFATPDCDGVPTWDIVALLLAVLQTLKAGVGPIAAGLALFESIRSPRAPHTRTAWLVVLSSTLAALLLQHFYAPISLVPAAVALWWLAARGAMAIIRRQPSMAAQGGAMALLALVPVLQAASVSGTYRSEPASPTPARAILQALDDMWWQGSLVAEDAASNLLPRIWRAGGRHARFLQIVDGSSEQAAEALRTRAVYAFERGAHRLALRGIWVGPVDPPPPAAAPVLWRAQSAVGCERVSGDWRTLTPLAAEGQLSAVFSKGGTGRHAIVYAAVPKGTRISPIAWPRLALRGYRAIDFDMTNEAERELAFETVQADGFPLSLLPAGIPFLARLLIEHVEPMPGALAVAFDAPPQALVARRDTGTAADPLEVCRSSQDLTVVGHREAPRVTVLDLTSPAVVGRGWHLSERPGEVSFRWTAAPAAEIRFLAIRPATLTLAMHILEIAGGRGRDNLSVSLNGAPAPCERANGECTWVLPIEAMNVGLNVITLHAPVTRGPAADPRPLGLKVAAAELRHRGLTGRDFALRPR